MTYLRRLLVPALALILGACAGQPQSTLPEQLAVTQPPGPTVTAPATTAPPQPTATAPAPIATIAATQPPPSPTRIPPTVVPTITIAAATATAIPAAAPAPTLLISPTVQPAAEYPHVFPVRSDGKVSYGKFHHDYPAADMFCAIGSEFLAVTDGTVDFVSREDLWDPRVNAGATRGGLAVAIIGDDGVRYYGSHLSKVADGIAPGGRVTVGQVLGLTGKSGDAVATQPHLHFGISHPTTPEDWAVRRGEIAPYRYLQAWQRGENITPTLP